MSQTSWRTAAGALGLAIGSFVVFAQDRHEQLAADERPLAVVMPMQDAQCPYPCPVEAPPIIETTPTPVVMFEPIPIEAPTPPKVEMATVPTCPLLASTSSCETTPCPAKPATTPVSVRTAVALSQVAPAIGVSIPYKVRIENTGGTTRLELMRGEEVALRINCDRVDVQMPGAGLCATGKVTLSAPGIEVRCARITVGWQNGDVVMEGQVRVQCQNGGHSTEMAAETINCRLSSMGTGLEFAAPKTAAIPPY